MTAQIVSRTHPAGLLLSIPPAPHAPQPEQLPPGRHRVIAGTPNLRVTDLAAEAQIAPTRRYCHATPYRPLTGRALWLTRLAVAAITGAAIACCWDLATPDTVTAVAGSAAVVPRMSLAGVRRILGRLVGLEVHDPRDYALVVSMHATTGEVRIEHQNGDDTQANRDMARLAAEVIDELGVEPVNRELVLIDVRRGEDQQQ